MMQLPIEHSNPAFYSLNDASVASITLKNLKFDRKELMETNEKYKSHRLKYRDNFLGEYFSKDILENIPKIYRLAKRIEYLKKVARGEPIARVEYNIPQIKQTPMDTITEILPSGFFVHNPFRKEKSPSNSLHWDKRANRYYDFATNTHGDVLDLYMAVHNCDLSTALRELS